MVESLIKNAKDLIAAGATNLVAGSYVFSELILTTLTALTHFARII